MLLEYAAAFAAEISVLQCGQMRTATAHLSVRASNNRRNQAVKKRETPREGWLRLESDWKWTPMYGLLLWRPVRVHRTGHLVVSEFGGEWFSFWTERTAARPKSGRPLQNHPCLWHLQRPPALWRAAFCFTHKQNLPATPARKHSPAKSASHRSVRRSTLVVRRSQYGCALARLVVRIEVRCSATWPGEILPRRSRNNRTRRSIPVGPGAHQMPSAIATQHSLSMTCSYEAPLPLERSRGALSIQARSRTWRTNLRARKRP
jgi:hypothetical protein